MVLRYPDRARARFPRGLPTNIRRRVAVIYVIGGNRQQALDHINRKRLAPAQAIDSPDELRALRAPEVVLIGTYLMRDDRQAFDALLEEIDATVTFEA